MGGFLSVKTAKTGETVDIPIFPMLAEELAEAKAKAGTSEFCFPDPALMYRSNPDGITWRVKQVIARALDSWSPKSTPTLPATADLAEIRARVEAYLGRLGDSARVPRMRAVFESYAGGANLGQVMTAAGCSRGTVSNYLNELEREVGASIIRGNRRGVKVDVLQRDRENGQRRASLHDFHSFRVTWITLALAAGVPLELVQRVTGHRTVTVVLKHYFRPGRDDFRQHLLNAMPRLLSQGLVSTPSAPQIREIVEGMTAQTWRAGRVRLLDLLPR